MRELSSANATSVPQEGVDPSPKLPRSGKPPIRRDKRAAARELSLTRELLAEVRTHRDQLQTQVELLLHDRERDADQRDELLRMLAGTQADPLSLGQRRGPLPSGRATEPPGVVPSTVGDSERSGPDGRLLGLLPRGDKRNLGASLVVTGVVGVLSGLALHLMLKAHTIDSTTHLGYIIGLVGLIVLLIGLVLVY